MQRLHRRTVTRVCIFSMFLRRHRTQCKKTYYYQNLGIYYERCHLTETLLSGEIRDRINTYIRDYCLVENIHIFYKQS